MTITDFFERDLDKLIEEINLYKNENDIVNALHSITPYFNKSILSKHMKMHLNLTSQELISYINKKWADSIIAFEKAMKQMSLMADYLVVGIAKQ